MWRWCHYVCPLLLCAGQGAEVYKTVFLIFFQGDQLKTKVRKICEGCVFIAYNNNNSNDNSKVAKYVELASIHIFYLVAIETRGTWNHWACPENWQTGHNNHWRTQRIHLSVSAVVSSPPKRKCGRLPQHVWLRLDAVAVIPWLVQCLKPRLCASGRKNNTFTVGYLVAITYLLFLNFSVWCVIK